MLCSGIKEGVAQYRRPMRTTSLTQIASGALARRPLSRLLKNTVRAGAEIGLSGYRPKEHENAMQMPIDGFGKRAYYCGVLLIPSASPPVPLIS